MTPSALAIQDLIHALDQAAAIQDDHARCDAVAEALREAVRRQPLDESLVQPIESGYGRRLVHRDPEGRYTVVAMAWGAGQGTPIHDHSGLWCVECVYRGQIEVEKAEYDESEFDEPPEASDEADDLDGDDPDDDDEEIEDDEFTASEPPATDDSEE